MSKQKRAGAWVVYMEPHRVPQSNYLSEEGAAKEAVLLSATHPERDYYIEHRYDKEANRPCFKNGKMTGFMLSRKAHRDISKRLFGF